MSKQLEEEKIMINFNVFNYLNSKGLWISLIAQFKLLTTLYLIESTKKEMMYSVPLTK